MKTSTTEKGLEFPMDCKRISKFEKNNPNIAVNVLFVSEKKEIESLECMQILFEELEPLYCIRYLFEEQVKRDAINDEFT